MIEWLNTALDFFIHLDQHMMTLTAEYGVWAYAILFVIVFAETGLVVTPFLPGDSLLFAAGAVCVVGSLNAPLLIVLLIVAAVLGDGVNYAIGARFGERLFTSESSKFFNKRHLTRTHEFYEKYGGKTIVLARFMPIVRTFAPFVAGIGKMRYSKFVVFNIVGAIVWVAGFVVLGMLFANQDYVKKNFSLVIIAIIVISLLPMFVEIVRENKRTLTKKHGKSE